MYYIKKWMWILFSCLCVSIGIQFLTASDLVIGGTAGLGIVMQHLTGVSFGVLFFTINLPFYFLAISQLGILFTIRSFISVSIMSAMSDTLALMFSFELPHPLIGAIVGGSIIGFGLIFLFREGSSLGGFNMLCIFLDKRFGINPGKTMFLTDILIVASALIVFGIVQVIYSAIAIFMMTTILGRYHKRAPIERHSTQEDDEIHQKQTVSNL
ncbi:YitT family protein [Mesobacillus maritimus]|uniref:YitT family protein n=1 Tax=Mesobacillus maritimus TaxID=1643336 RepID=UPI00203F2408|nr:YitT family protein [Mesobacillus maritimus]MCM3585800.1 YitT family protein [Mesobacillus maritimus]MCM3670560.1 YitT family protein [Mesobacillus maritimus]